MNKPDDQLYREMLATRVKNNCDRSFKFSICLYGQPSKDNIGGLESFKLYMRPDGLYNLDWGSSHRPRHTSLKQTLEQVKATIEDICLNKAPEYYCISFLQKFQAF